MVEPVESVLVLYDGVCGLCNRTVRFLLRIDRRRRLKFAPLQGEPAKEIVARHGVPDDLDTFVLARVVAGREVVSVRSAAVLDALAAVGGVWRLSAVFRLVPRPVRDRIYDWIAARRYRWFGKYDSCPTPRPEDRERFLF